MAARKNKLTVYNCSIIELPKIETEGGNITPVHPNINVPFDIKRVFYSYDIPGGEARGAHAHKECHQFLVAASGAYEVLLDDGVTVRSMVFIYPQEFGRLNKLFPQEAFALYSHRMAIVRRTTFVNTKIT